MSHVKTGGRQSLAPELQYVDPWYASLLQSTLSDIKLLHTEHNNNSIFLFIASYSLCHYWMFTFPCHTPHNKWILFFNQLIIF